MILECDTLNEESIVLIENYASITKKQQGMTIDFGCLAHHDEDVMIVTQLQNQRLNDYAEQILVQEVDAELSTQYACGIDDSVDEGSNLHRRERIRAI